MFLEPCCKGEGIVLKHIYNDVSLAKIVNIKRIYIHTHVYTLNTLNTVYAVTRFLQYPSIINKYLFNKLFKSNSN